MHLLNKFNKGICFLLCVIDIYSKYAWVVPLKDKIKYCNNNAFQKLLDESGRKQNKIWADKGSEFLYRPLKSWLARNGVEMYSLHNKRRSVIAERFIRILKNKIYKHMISVSRNVYITKLDDIVTKYSIS